MLVDVTRWQALSAAWAEIRQIERAAGLDVHEPRKSSGIISLSYEPSEQQMCELARTWQGALSSTLVVETFRPLSRRSDPGILEQH